MAVAAFAATRAGAELTPLSFEIDGLAADEVELEVSHCGICHSDIHMIDDDWAISRYPLVPGHEAIGIISAVGAAVDPSRIGQRVGVSWQSASCGHCSWCTSAQEHLCRAQQATCVGRHGGYASRLRVQERFAFALPDGLSSAAAAPLLCAGITVYAPLIHCQVKATHRVGIIGIGGLGHLALQFASSLGCEVVALSSTPGKQREAAEFGADDFLLTGDRMQMKNAAASFDFLMSAVTVDLPWSDYLNLLKPRGTLCFVGASPGTVEVPVSDLIVGHKTICGSAVGSCTDMAEMLAFAARHQIGAAIELFPLAKVNEALAKVRANTIRYRAVLEMPAAAI